MSEFVWGPEIAVNGKRPEWLNAETPCDIKENFAWFDTNGIMHAEDWNWSSVKAIRLPADHPHYATLATPTAPNTPAGYSDEVVERMVALVREIAVDREPDKSGVVLFNGTALVEEARAIVALLPEPVDADLNAAREAEAKACEANGFHDYAAETRAGKRDDGPVRHRYEGIKLGRALAEGDRSMWPRA